MTLAEQQAKQAEVNQTELSEKSHQLATVRNQLEGEKLQRSASLGRGGDGKGGGGG